MNTGSSGPVESQQWIDRGPVERNERLRGSPQPPQYSLIFSRNTTPVVEINIMKHNPRVIPLPPGDIE